MSTVSPVFSELSAGHLNNPKRSHPKRTKTDHLKLNMPIVSEQSSKSLFIGAAGLLALGYRFVGQEMRWKKDGGSSWAGKEDLDATDSDGQMIHCR